MKLKNQIFAILAVFCVIFSACAVCAADNGNLSMTDGDNYDPGVPYHADGSNPKDAADYVIDEDMSEHGVPHHSDGTDPKDAADYVIDEDMSEHGVPYHADGSDPTQTPIGNETGNATPQAAGAPAATTHTMPATGNPILVLLAIGAVLGGATLINKRR